MNDSSLVGLSARVPPTNLQAEQALLGAILANNSAYDMVAGFLLGDHFADPINGRIYDEIGARIASGRLADAISLRAALEHSGVLDPVGGMAYLAQLLTALVSTTVSREYGRAIRDSWHRRQLIDIGSDLVHQAFTGDSAASVHEAAETRLFELSEGAPDDVVIPAHEAMAQAIDLAVKAKDEPGGVVGLRTGLTALDEITGGLRRGQYILIGARPSMGKTTLGLSIAAGAARHGARVLFGSREMTALAIGAQIVAGLSPVQRDGATRGRVREHDGAGRFTYRPISPPEIDLMTAAQRAMASQHLLIDECRAGTIAAVRARARREKRRRGLDLIVLDYLGLFRVPELARSDNRVLEVSRLSEQIKALARDLGVPVIVLSQLNRGTEGREDKRPTLADLRDSGSLEQDADVVMFLYREHYYLLRKPPARAEARSATEHGEALAKWNDYEARARGRAELMIAKQREGRIGKIDIAFSDDTTWFTDLPMEFDTDGKR
jgi:replicative DNA helicase